MGKKGAFGFRKKGPPTLLIFLPKMKQQNTGVQQFIAPFIIQNSDWCEIGMGPVGERRVGARPALGGPPGAILPTSGGGDQASV